ncbi:hypothetical protein Tco_0280613 [Tanacetum coccineum]
MWYQSSLLLISRIVQGLCIEFVKKKKAAKIHSVIQGPSHAIAWKISDIKGIDLQFCTHKILMEENAKPVVQHQRRVNPKIHEVIKQEVTKLLNAGLIYPISDSPWVSLVHCVPKKGGITMVKNEENELIPTRLVTGWRVCIDYQKLNDATRKYHFPLPFMDQMLERVNETKIELTLEQSQQGVSNDVLKILLFKLENLSRDSLNYLLTGLEDGVAASFKRSSDS